MAKKKAKQRNTPVLSVLAVAFATLGVFAWRNVLIYNSPVIAAWESVGEPVLPVAAVQAMERIVIPSEPEAVFAEPVEETEEVSNHDDSMDSGEDVGVPVRITIASIDVDAAVENVGLTADGSMDVPKDPFDTGWYELGPRPGEIGSATITGHVDWLFGSSGVFANLHRLMPGDIITVQDENGSDVSFVVREIRKYDAQADATDVFISTDGEAHLNIITCNGAWDAAAHQYSERLVVFADKVI